jgi:hypothetical protein
MRPKTPPIKKKKPGSALAQSYAKGICNPDTSEAIYDVIDSDDIVASTASKKRKKVITKVI